MAIAIRIYKKKGIYSKNEAKGSENEDSAESALKSELSMQNTANENQKEFFFWLLLMIWSNKIIWQSDFLARPGGSHWTEEVLAHYSKCNGFETYYLICSVSMIAVAGLFKLHAFLSYYTVNAFYVTVN